MKVQKKMKNVLIVLLLTLSWGNKLAAQVTVDLEPDNYTDIIDIINGIHPNTVQVSSTDIDNFITSVMSTFSYTPSLPYIDAELSYLDDTHFKVDWSDNPAYRKYLVGALDLDNGNSVVDGSSATTFGSPFLGNGPTLFMIHGESESRSGRIRFIIIDKIGMFTVYDDPNIVCSCSNGGELENIVEPETEAYRTMRIYPIGLHCGASEYALRVSISGDLGETEQATYLFYWQVDLVEESISLGNSCGDQLTLNMSNGGIGENLISTDGRLMLRIGSEAITIQTISGLGLSLNGASITRCCSRRSREATDPIDPIFYLRSSTPNSELNSNIKVFPNPSKDELNIEIVTEVEAISRVQLISPQGILLMDLDEKALIDAGQQIKLDIQNYPEGIYYLMLEENDKQHVKKVIFLK